MQDKQLLHLHHLQALDGALGMLYLHSLKPPLVHRDLKVTWLALRGQACGWLICELCVSQSMCLQSLQRTMRYRTAAACE
jgi:serine/threonine protein kinase